MKTFGKTQMRAVLNKILVSSFTLGVLMVILGNSISGLGIGLFVLLVPIALSFIFGILYSFLHKKHISKVERYKILSVNLLSLFGGLVLVFPVISKELGWMLMLVMIVVGFVYYALTIYFFLGLGSSFYIKRRKEEAAS